MNILFEEHLTILSSLVTHDVKFMLVGGYAVIHYGYRRTTGDMDLWIKPDNQNRVQLLKALQSLEFDIDSLAELSKCDFT